MFWFDFPTYLILFRALTKIKTILGDCIWTKLLQQNKTKLFSSLLLYNIDKKKSDKRRAWNHLLSFKSDRTAAQEAFYQRYSNKWTLLLGICIVYWQETKTPRHGYISSPCLLSIYWFSIQTQYNSTWKM